MLMASPLENLLQLIGALLIFAFVLAITYLTTKWMGAYQKGRTIGKNLQIVETIGVGNNKMISIIAAGNKYLVVSIGKEEVHLLAELSREDLKDTSFLEEQPAKHQESFQEIMGRLKDKLPKKQG